MKRLFGVSPAFFISRHGTSFGCDDMVNDLPLIKEIGFSSWQPEIFKPERLNEWEEGAWKKLRDLSLEYSLATPNFMAHFLLHSFESAEKLHSDWGIGQCERVVRQLEQWPEISLVSIPLIDFGPVQEKDKERLIKKLSIMCSFIEDAGKTCALELLPGSLVPGSLGFLDLIKNRGLENLTINLDSGHFNAMGESSAQIVDRLGDFIGCTHFCDNDGLINNSFVPGAGSVDWQPYREWLQKGTFSGSLDVEIICESSRVKEEYAKGLASLKELIEE